MFRLHCVSTINNGIFFSSAPILLLNLGPTSIGISMQRFDLISFFASKKGPKNMLEPFHRRCDTSIVYNGSKFNEKCRNQF